MESADRRPQRHRRAVARDAVLDVLRVDDGRRNHVLCRRDALVLPRVAEIARIDWLPGRTGERRAELNRLQRELRRDVEHRRGVRASPRPRRARSHRGRPSDGPHDLIQDRRAVWRRRLDVSNAIPDAGPRHRHVTIGPDGQAFRGDEERYRRAREELERWSSVSSFAICTALPIALPAVPPLHVSVSGS
jgi:hypothetical protein